jgi:hypothetical protein
VLANLCSQIRANPTLYIHVLQSTELGFLEYNISSAIGSVFGPSSEREDPLLLVEAKSSIIDLGRWDLEEPGDIVFWGETCIELKLIRAAGGPCSETSVLSHLCILL